MIIDETSYYLQSLGKRGRVVTKYEIIFIVLRLAIKQLYVGYEQDISRERIVFGNWLVYQTLPIALLVRKKEIPQCFVNMLLFI